VAEHLASWLSWSLLMLGEFQHRQDRLPVLGQGKRGKQRFRGRKECVAATSIASSNHRNGHRGNAQWGDLI